MRKKIYLGFVFAILLLTFSFIGKRTLVLQAEDIKDERELKAVWMSTFIGEAPYSNENQFKNHMNEAFDIFEYYGINALIFHVRTHNNAFYPSELNPLVSSWRNVNFEQFDPIGWIIKESHKRGIEFHAWMNPYRVSTSSQTGTLPESNPQSDPDNLIVEGGSVILNPAKEVVKEHIYNTINEFIELYPTVDAIHFDDYFWIKTGANPVGANSRRAHIDELIEGIHHVLKDFNETNKTAIQLGISPTGIYKNGNGLVTYDEEGMPISTGSLTNGFAHYGNYLYADTVKWAIEGWIDYLIPQTYWSRNHPTASYTNLVDWWDKVFKNLDTNLYLGIGAYMADESSNTYDWKNNMHEMSEQYSLIEEKEHLKGYSIFSYKHLKGAYYNSSNKSSIQINNAYDDPLRRKVRILPEINSIDKIEAPYVSNFYNNDGILTWDKTNDAKFYYIYHSEEELTYSSDEIIGVVGQENETMSYDVSDYQGNFGIRTISKTNHLSPFLKEDEIVIAYKSEDISSTEIIVKGSKAPLIEEPTREGHLFLGWYLEDELFDFNSVINNNITLIAKWEKIFYYVNLTLHYGYDSLVEVMKIEEGFVPEKPDDPTRLGYTFLGWFFNEQEFNFNKPLLNNITLVAKWEEKYLDVWFFDSYEGLIDTTTIQEGSKIKEPDSLIKEGYQFLGWYLNNELFDFNTQVKEDIVLFAKWDLITEINVTVIIGDSVEIITVLKYDLLTLIDAPFIEGYEFSGWYLDDELFNFLNPITTEITLTAVYELIEKFSVILIDEDQVEDLLVLKNEKIVEPFTPHKEGHLFIGWYLNDLLFDFETKVTEDLIIVAKYKSASELKNVSVYKDTQIREKTSDNIEGLVYYGIINISLKNNEHGFYLIYGKTTFEELNEKITNSKDNVFYINDKEVFKVIVKGVNTDGTYSVVLTGIPEIGYDDSITVVPYVVNDEGKIVIPQIFKVSSFNNAKGLTTTQGFIFKSDCLLTDLKRKDQIIK